MPIEGCSNCSNPTAAGQDYGSGYRDPATVRAERLIKDQAEKLAAVRANGPTQATTVYDTIVARRNQATEAAEYLLNQLVRVGIPIPELGGYPCAPVGNTLDRLEDDLAALRFEMERIQEFSAALARFISGLGGTQ